MLKKNKISKTSSEDITNDKVQRNDRLEEESFVPYKDLVRIIEHMKQLLPAVGRKWITVEHLGNALHFFNTSTLPYLRLP